MKTSKACGVLSNWPLRHFAHWLIWFSRAPCTADNSGYWLRNNTAKSAKCNCHMHSSLLQFRSPCGQKSAMGGCYGVRGRSPKQPEAIHSLTAKPPAAEAGGLEGTALSRRRHVIIKFHTDNSTKLSRSNLYRPYFIVKDKIRGLMQRSLREVIGNKLILNAHFPIP